MTAARRMEDLGCTALGRVLLQPVVGDAKRVEGTGIMVEVAVAHDVRNAGQKAVVGGGGRGENETGAQAQSRSYRKGCKAYTVP